MNIENITIKTKTCSACGAHTTGTQCGADFQCRDCDPETFDAVAEAQKEAFLLGAQILNGEAVTQ